MSKKSNDWLPSKRGDRLAMAVNWGECLSELNDVLNIPQATLTKFSQATESAKIAIAVPEGARNAISNAQLKAAFDELVAMMRDIKKRYFYNPSLRDDHFAALGLKPKDTIPTTVGNPVGLVTATVKYPNEGALELNIKHVAGSPYDSRANYGVKIRYGVFPADAHVATDVNQLYESRFTRKKKELITFDRKDKQKTACFCLRYENSKGAAGQWGAIISAVIP
jgi:hypothetical protein